MFATKVSTDLEVETRRNCLVFSPSKSDISIELYKVALSERNERGRFVGWTRARVEDRSKVFLGKKTLEIDSGTKFTSLRKRSSKQSRFEFDRSNRSGEIGADSVFFSFRRLV